MSMRVREILLTLFICLLCAGAASAGPGWVGSENGDPYQPEIANPIDNAEVSIDSVDTARGATVTKRSENTPSAHEVLFRVYLKLFRIFLR